MAIPTLRQSAEAADGLPGTPDFDAYPVAEAIAAATTDGEVVTVAWSDGVTSRYHALWLRENAADPATINSLTRESTYDLAASPGDLSASSVSIDAAGALAVRFEPDGHETAYHPGWLRAHDYSNGPAAAIDPVRRQVLDGGRSCRTGDL